MFVSILAIVLWTVGISGLIAFAVSAWFFGIIGKLVTVTIIAIAANFVGRRVFTKKTTAI